MGRLLVSPERRTRVERVSTGGSGSGGAPPGPTGLEAAILALAPLGYWKLDETSGTTANDVSTNARHGTYSGTVTLANTAGPASNYPTFGGGQVTIADNNVFSVNTTPGMTWFALVKPTSVAGTSVQRFIMSKGSGSGAFEWELFLGYTTGSTLSHVLYRTTTNIEQLYSNTATGVLGTAWQAIAVSVSTYTGAEYQKMYRNGNTDLWATGSTGTGAGVYQNTTAAVSIGYRADNPGAGTAWAGSIAHAAIFAGVLTTTQIQTMMDAADVEGWF